MKKMALVVEGTALVVAIAVEIATADDLSNTDIGIHSNEMNLTGDGIGIGMVEPQRPGKPGYDTDPTKLNSLVVPTDVFRGNGVAPGNFDIDDHAENVAGVMISRTAGTFSDGVAPDALLYGSREK